MAGSFEIGQLLRVVISLGVVIAIMAIAARVLRRRGVGLGGSRGRRPVGSGAIELIARRGLTKSTSIAVVRIGERHLVVGVTEASVQVLTEGDPETLGLVEAAPKELEAIGTTPLWGSRPNSTRMALLDVMRSWTVRRV
jgi:flagellar protein FliO/FliZ